MPSRKKKRDESSDDGDDGNETRTPRMPPRPKKIKFTVEGDGMDSDLETEVMKVLRGGNVKMKLTLKLTNGRRDETTSEQGKRKDTDAKHVEPKKGALSPAKTGKRGKKHGLGDGVTRKQVADTIDRLELELVRQQLIYNDAHKTLHEYKTITLPNGETRGGLVCTSTSRDGLRILVDRPVLSVPHSDDLEIVKARVLEAYGRLDAKAKALYDELHSNGKPGDVWDIFNTNAVSIGEQYTDTSKKGFKVLKRDVAVQAQGVFPKFSRINHSCDPNCWFDFKKLANKVNVFSLKKIIIHEEITVDYMINNQYSSHKKRREALKEGWGIVCDSNCKQCNRSAEEIEKSDERRAEMLRLSQVISAHNKAYDNEKKSTPFPVEFPSLTARFRHLLNKEGILFPGPADLKFDESKYWYSMSLKDRRTGESTEERTQRAKQGEKALKLARESLKMFAFALGFDAENVEKNPEEVTKVLDLIRAIKGVDYELDEDEPLRSELVEDELFEDDFGDVAPVEAECSDNEYIE